MDQYNSYENYELDNGTYSFELSEKDKLALDEAIWIVDNKVSIRQTAKEFCRSKSAVHTDVTVKVKSLSYELYSCVKRQLKCNKEKYFK